MRNYLLPTALFGSIASGTLFAIAIVSYASPALALSPVEIQRIAKQATVQISGCAYGSGVIIRKDGNTYTVLSVAHNFEKSGCEIVAPDDTKYPITKVKTFPSQVDLAVFTFTSSNSYSVAKLIDNSDRVEATETIYVSGFPLSTAINSAVFTIVKGDVVANPQTKQQGKGYSLIYSNNTLPGQSGGPVWNSKGEVIAIHGQGDVDTKLQTTMNENRLIKTGYNLGITVNTFMKLATAAGISGYAPVFATTLIKPKPVEDLIASAVEKERKSNYKGMLVDMNRAIALDSQNARLYYLRGYAKSKIWTWIGSEQTGHSFTDYKSAISDFNRAIALKPNYAEAYIRRAYARDYSGDKKGAISDYDRAIALEATYGNADVYYNRAQAKLKLGNKRGAIEDYTLTIGRNSEHVQAYYERGQIKLGLGDKQGAIEDFTLTIAHNGRYTPAYYDRAQAKSKLGDKQGAIEDLKIVAKVYQEEIESMKKFGLPASNSHVRWYKARYEKVLKEIARLGG
jgi:tetratricopeptide (TPR) repeat protein